MPAFIVHCTDKEVQLERAESELYIFKPTLNATISSNNNIFLFNHTVDSVEENKKLLCDRQFQ
jgi:hypothetical protein